MKRRIIETEDGSKTIHIEGWGESYHSIHGAVQEARHVFINNGLCFYFDKFSDVKILEVGFGTGLNAFITLLEAESRKIKINYVGVEKYPINNEEFLALNYFEDVFKFYPELLDRREEFYSCYLNMFNCDWEKSSEISSYFKLTKVEKDFFDLKETNYKDFDLVYFDAFGSKVQPELWEEELFDIIVKMMKEQSVLTTYAAKGNLKRALKKHGFNVQKRPGPPGKREMMVSFRNFNDE